jgi:lauroyl/myristoyl acyltransferase
MDKSKITLQTVSNSRFGVALALTLARYFPRWMGYRIARGAARFIATRRSSLMLRALRANQWVVSGGKLSARELDQVAKTVLLRHTRCLYDFYRNLNHPEEVLRLVRFSQEFQDLFDNLKSGNKAALFIAPHISNFDLAGRALALRGLKFQILSFPQPTGGYEWQNQIRNESGMEVTPMSISATHKAKHRLRSGGVVLTGLDRPINETRYYPRFFGRPAPLPVAYVHLALQTGAPIIVVSCVTLPDDTYELVCQPAVIPQPHADREIELISNAEMVLSRAEELIRRDPYQWAMFYPVWPDALEEAPSE